MTASELPINGARFSPLFSLASTHLDLCRRGRLELSRDDILNLNDCCRERYDALGELLRRHGVVVEV